MSVRWGLLGVVGVPGLALASPLEHEPDWFREGTFVGASYGQFLAIGDVDGDSIDDMVVSSQTDHEVFLGTSEGLQNSLAAVLPHELPSTSLAFCDVDGDGYEDLLSGEAPFIADNVTFIVRVYFGSAEGLDPAPAWEYSSEQVAFAGAGPVAACAGDLDGDGIDDVVIGLPQASPGLSLAGRAEVYLGTTFGLPGTPDQVINGVQAEALFGRAVAGVGDVDGDGFDDVVIGAPGYDAGQTNEGRAYLYRGRVGGLLNAPAKTWDSNVTNGNMGFAVAGGDVNGDTFADIAIGAPGFSGGLPSEGRTSLWFGTPTGLTTAPVWITEGNNEGALFGYALVMGDRDDDGYDDLAVGAPFANGMTGFVEVYSGGAAGLKPYPSETARDVGFSETPEVFGYALASGDVDGDGLDDLAVGALFYNFGAENEGAAIIWRGDPEVVLPGALQGGPHEMSSLGDGRSAGCATVPFAPGWTALLALIGVRRRSRR